MLLEDAIQLHEALHVWYCVDGYIAELQTQDGAKTVISGKGDTPEAAIEIVKAKLADVQSLADLRAMPYVSTLQG